jgi:hypothetical protein
MRREAAWKKDYTPVNPNEGDALLTDFFNTAIEAARANPEFGDGDVKAMGEALKQVYKEKVDEILARYNRGFFDP